MAEENEASPNQAEPTCVKLTPREQQVLALLRLGVHNKDIAARLGVREQTIKNYLSIILNKLGVSNRTKAALWAERHKAWLAFENSDSQ